MNLGFKRKFDDGTNTWFVYKIWMGLSKAPAFDNLGTWSKSLKHYQEAFQDRFNEPLPCPPATDLGTGRAKLHTIRKPRKGNTQWRAGMDIHFQDGNQYSPGGPFRFAPVIPCTAVESVTLGYPTEEGKMVILVGNKSIEDPKEQEAFAVNDGFNDLDHLRQWFFPDQPKGKQEEFRTFTGHLIHWTRLRYDKTPAE